MSDVDNGWNLPNSFPLPPVTLSYTKPIEESHQPLDVGRDEWLTHFPPPQLTSNVSYPPSASSSLSYPTSHSLSHNSFTAPALHRSTSLGPGTLRSEHAQSTGFSEPQVVQIMTREKFFVETIMDLRARLAEVTGQRDELRAIATPLVRRVEAIEITLASVNTTVNQLSSGAAPSNSSESIPSDFPLLNQNDYPLVSFWTQKEWQEASKAEQGLSGVRGRKRKMPDEQVTNNSLRFIQDENGIVIDCAIADSMRKYAIRLWDQLYNKCGLSSTTSGGLASSWTKVGNEIMNFYIHSMESQFHVLRLCHASWKAIKIAILNYPGWYHRRNGSLTGHLKVEPSDLDDLSDVDVTSDERSESVSRSTARSTSVGTKRVRQTAEVNVPGVRKRSRTLNSITTPPPAPVIVPQPPVDPSASTSQPIAVDLPEINIISPLGHSRRPSTPRHDDWVPPSPILTLPPSDTPLPLPPSPTPVESISPVISPTPFPLPSPEPIPSVNPSPDIIPLPPNATAPELGPPPPSTALPPEPTLSHSEHLQPPQQEGGEEPLVTSLPKTRKERCVKVLTNALTPRNLCAKSWVQTHGQGALEKDFATYWSSIQGTAQFQSWKAALDELKAQEKAAKKGVGKV